MKLAIFERNDVTFFISFLALDAGVSDEDFAVQECRLRSDVHGRQHHEGNE